eukprot:m.13706 g.13706  ORF g.13706 m.13706 type:complete len:395 (-) comp8213_c0_seq1:247-1431(-)
MLLSLILVAATVGAALPPRETVLAAGHSASAYYVAHVPPADEFSCGWTRSTLMLGLVELVKASDHPSGAASHADGQSDSEWNRTGTHDYLLRWANHYDWKLCGESQSESTAWPLATAVDVLPTGAALADNQLCGATYAELYVLDGMRNGTWIADTLHEFHTEMASNSTSLWSWVDALFMAMNTWSRIGAITADQRYFDQQFDDFSAAALEGPTPGETYRLWSEEHSLFFRDDRYLNSTVFWSRGNGWAMGALVTALQHSPPTDPHRGVYRELFQKQAAALKAIQAADGCWGGSLLNQTGYPAPETTGTSGFAYGIAYGINAGILPSEDYLSVVERAWSCLDTIALQPSGLFGYCQPVGASPDHNISPNSTSDFCVGLFALAVSQVAQLAPGAPS